MTMPNVMEMIAQLGPGPGPGPGPGTGPGHGPGPSPYPPHPSHHASGNGGDFPGAGKQKQPDPAEWVGKSVAGRTCFWNIEMTQRDVLFFSSIQTYFV